MSKNQKLVAQISLVADELGLESRAMDGAQFWVNSEDFDLESEIKSRLKFEFDSHKLCFKSDTLEYPYIETQLSVVLDDEEVGYYVLYSLLDGEAVDDALVITDEELKYS
ncbi:hypothetical protein [Pseudoalteromonas sp. S2755]|uniref:hypothetical protein n=1 Tax=Pseudoalteromonas sp. S2755 TaxID=2066523 RepID=UPI00110AFF0B|nr:hypothetical protein [Pseudoalteromonas sp. S2755]TMN43023.1 hypothetical protein CWC03_05560 [Pseudoalteromonas sp. S2755]